MDARRLQGWWFERQGLMNPRTGADPAVVLASTGWARSVGGSNPYLTLFARAGVGSEAAHAAVESLAIHELPSARGCTYVVPAEDYALALTVSQGFGDDAAIATAKKHLGVTDGELDRLCGDVLAALRDRALDPRELKSALGDAVRNLGPEGKKRGTTTTLPLALGRLQTSGRIRRVPMEPRLDQQRYRYTLWDPSPLKNSGLSREEAFTALARRFFRWIGPATAAQFQAFSGLGVGAAREASAPLGLTPVEEGSPLLILTEDREALLAYRPPAEPRYALVSCIDGITLFRRDIGSVVDPEDLSSPLLVGERGTAGSALMDLPFNGILDRGRVIGLWEYDPGEGAIAWATFQAAPEGLREAVARTEAFIREELGDARSFSLDSPESRKRRIEALRAAAG